MRDPNQSTAQVRPIDTHTAKPAPLQQAVQDAAKLAGELFKAASAQWHYEM